MHSVILYASQIAACIGFNRHKKPSEAMEAMWERAAPESYAAALQRTRTVTEGDRISSLLRDNEAVKRLVDTSMLDSAHSVDVSTKYDAATRAISASDMAPADKALIDTAVKRNLYTNYGTASEHHALVQVRETLGINARPDDTFYKLQIGEVDGVPLWVGGKIDAITDTRLVIEIKNRIRRLFYKVPFYEVVQLQTYLHLLDAPRGAIVECLTTHDNSHINIVPVRRDKDLWNDVIVPKMRAFTRVYMDLLRDDAFQDAYLLSPARATMIQTRINAASSL